MSFQSAASAAAGTRQSGFKLPMRSGTGNALNGTAALSACTPRGSPADADAPRCKARGPATCRRSSPASRSLWRACAISGDAGMSARVSVTAIAYGSGSASAPALRSWTLTRRRAAAPSRRPCARRPPDASAPPSRRERLGRRRTELAEPVQRPQRVEGTTVDADLVDRRIAHERRSAAARRPSDRAHEQALGVETPQHIVGRERREQSGRILLRQRTAR